MIIPPFPGNTYFQARHKDTKLCRECGRLYHTPKVVKGKMICCPWCGKEIKKRKLEVVK